MHVAVWRVDAAITSIQMMRVDRRESFGTGSLMIDCLNQRYRETDNSHILRLVAVSNKARARQRAKGDATASRQRAYQRPPRSLRQSHSADSPVALLIRQLTMSSALNHRYKDVYTYTSG